MGWGIDTEEENLEDEGIQGQEGKVGEGGGQRRDRVTGKDTRRYLGMAKGMGRGRGMSRGRDREGLKG